MRPQVTVHFAQTLDGRIATRTGHSKWISGEGTRRAPVDRLARVQASGADIAVASTVPREASRWSGDRVIRSRLTRVEISARPPGAL